MIKANQHFFKIFIAASFYPIYIPINTRIIDVSKESISITPITIESVIEKRQELRITCTAKGEFNSNTVTGEILLGFTYVDGNQYQQNIIKNYEGYQIGLPKAIET